MAEARAAPDGQWIAASEWQVRDIFQELTRDGYQLMLQARADTHPTAQAAAFPPADNLILRNKGQPPRRVLTADGGPLPARWSAEDAAVAPRGPTRIDEGTDGVMAPTVTQAEKDQRWQKQITRRQQRGKAGVGNARPLPQRRAGSDERFKVMKIGIFYDQDKIHRHVFATESGCADYGPLLASYATQIGFERADETISLVDGAPWIYTQVCAALLCLQAILLDVYHRSQHIHQTAVCGLGNRAEPATFAVLIPVLVATADYTNCESVVTASKYCLIAILSEREPVPSKNTPSRSRLLGRGTA